MDLSLVDRCAVNPFYVRLSFSSLRGVDSQTASLFRPILQYDMLDRVQVTSG